MEHGHEQTYGDNKYIKIFRITFIGPFIANIFAENNQQDATFLSLFL